MFDPDSHDPQDAALWRLLGNARPVKPAPFFARRVLRAIDEPSAAARHPASLGWWLRFAAPGFACSVLVAVALVGAQTPRSADAQLEFDAISNLDLYVSQSNDESSLWLDPSFSSP